MTKLKMKKSIIFIIILLDILLICLAGAIYLLIKKNPTIEIEQAYMYNISSDEPEDMLEKQKVTSIIDLKLVEKNIQNYYDTINIKADKYYDRNGNILITDKQLNDGIIGMLSEEYIDNKQINSNNLDDYIKKTNKKLFPYTLDMYYIKKNEIYKYIASGILIDDNNKLNDRYYMYVNIDTQNRTFSIEPISQKEYTEGKPIINIKSIESNNYNKYNVEEIGAQEIIKDYINRFKRLTLVNPEFTYNLLESSYKEKKFENIDKYKEYVENNEKRITEIYITDYFINYYDDYEEYVCTDKNGFYYIIKQDLKNCLNYEFTLDTYTVENDSFIKKYDNSSNQYKVGINIDKVISAINSKDFEFMYEKLDDSFKSKYFDDAGELGEFLKSNLFEFNKVSYVKFTENGNDIYTYNLKISSYDEENKEIKDMTIIMKLLENRDFIMSFSL